MSEMTVQSIHSLADSLNNGFASVCITLPDEFDSPNVSPAQSGIECTSGTIKFNGLKFVPDPTAGPLLSERNERMIQ